MIIRGSFCFCIILKKWIGKAWEIFFWKYLRAIGKISLLKKVFYIASLVIDKFGMYPSPGRYCKFYNFSLLLLCGSKKNQQDINVLMIVIEKRLN